MNKYINVIGNADKADILIIGCDPTALNSTKRIEAPFALSEAPHDKEITHYRNRYFNPVFRSLCKLYGLDMDEQNEDTRRFMRERVVITNAVGEEVIVYESDSGKAIQTKLETSKALKKGKERESVWYRYFTKEGADASWRKQLTELAARDNIKDIYITAECLVTPLLKDKYWSQAEKRKVELKDKMKDVEENKKKYGNVCIDARETIFGKELRPLYRHHTYVDLLDKYCGSTGKRGI